MAKIGLGRSKPDMNMVRERIEVFGSQTSKAYQRGVSKRECEYRFVAFVQQPLRQSDRYDCIIKAQKNTSLHTEGDGDAAEYRGLLIRQLLCST